MQKIDTSNPVRVFYSWTIVSFIVASFLGSFLWRGPQYPHEFDTTKLFVAAGVLLDLLSLTYHLMGHSGIEALVLMLYLFACFQSSHPWVFSASADWKINAILKLFEMMFLLGLNLICNLVIPSLVKRWRFRR